MNGADLDARLRRHFAGVDTGPDFGAHLRARVAAMPPVPVAELRHRCEQQRDEARERLRREAWTRMATAVGAGVAALAILWRNAPAVTAWVRGALEAAAGGGSTTLVVLALGAAVLWPLLQRPDPA